jgi:predicted metalloenzyme YecM
MKDVLGDYVAFIKNIDRGLNELGIVQSELAEMDHVCYRVETIERYTKFLDECHKWAILLGESEVNGRKIATFEFNDYLQAGNWVVPYLEVPAPKEGSPYEEGLEHAELVVVGSLDRFLRRHSQLTFSYKGMNKQINPEAGLKTAGISVKFHEQQLGAVVRIEKALDK